MANPCKVALKMQINWATRLNKPISETRNGNDVSMYVSFVHSRIRNVKRYI